MRKIWTEQERQLLKEVYPDKYTSEVSKILGRSYSSVSTQAQLLGISKSEAFKEMELSKQAERLREIGVKSRFPKGHVPANLGKELPLHVREKLSATMFKKYNIPHNTKHDGYERLSRDGYIELRLGLGHFVLKHRHIWEQVNGKIPEGMLVVFKDKNPLNINIENLELITKAENMKRNTIQRFPSELINTILTLRKLKKTINEKQN